METFEISLLIAFIVLTSIISVILTFLLYRVSFENPGIIARSFGWDPRASSLASASNLTTVSSSSGPRTAATVPVPDNSAGPDNTTTTTTDSSPNDNPMNPPPPSISGGATGTKSTENDRSSSGSTFYGSSSSSSTSRWCICLSRSLFRRKGTVLPTSLHSTPSHRSHTLRSSVSTDIHTPTTNGGGGAVIAITNPEDSGKLPENKVRSPITRHHHTTNTVSGATRTTTNSHNTVISPHANDSTNTNGDNKYGWLSKWDIPVDKLRFKYLIGKGNFGEVYLGTWLGSPVAIKTILPNLQSNDKLVNRFMEEIALMASLHHPNVVLFLGACTKRPNLAIVLEYCVHGSLHHFLKSTSVHGIKISMSLIYRFALDIARGVYYLHRRCNVIQRDLKARNILVDGSLNAKVADFGLSRVVDEEEANKLTACGTPAWTAPEIVKMERYTEKVDVYSFGIIMWELIAREEPYGGQKGVQIAYAAAEQGLRPEIPSFCPTDFAELMRECWSDDPDDRPTFASILKRLFQMKKNCDRETAKALANPSRTTSHFALEQLPKFVPTNAGGAMIEPRNRRKQRVSTHSTTTTNSETGVPNMGTTTTAQNTESNRRIPSASSNHIATSPSSSSSSQKNSRNKYVERQSSSSASSTSTSPTGHNNTHTSSSVASRSSRVATSPSATTSSGPTDNRKSKVTIAPEIRTVTETGISRYTNIDDGIDPMHGLSDNGASIPMDGFDTRDTQDTEAALRTEDSHMALLSRIGYAGSMRTNDDDILAGELEEGMTLGSGRFLHNGTNAAQELVDQGIVNLETEKTQDKWDGSVSTDEDDDNEATNGSKNRRPRDRTSPHPTPTRTNSKVSNAKGSTTIESTVSSEKSSTVSSSSKNRVPKQ